MVPDDLPERILAEAAASVQKAPRSSGACVVGCNDDSAAPAETGSLVVFSDDWGRHPSSCQHLVTQLLPRRQVHWINTIGTRPPRLDLKTIQRGLEKLRQWSAPPYVPESPWEGNPIVAVPKMWPWIRTPLDRLVNTRLLVHQLRSLFESLQAPPVVLSTVPFVVTLVGELPAKRWVYYCVDDFGAWPGLDGKTLTRFSEEYAARADVLVAVSEHLQTQLSRPERQVNLLTHGIDIDFWSNPVHTRATLPVSLAKVPQPWIVFWGLIDRRLDLDFLSRLSRSMREGSIILVGPKENPDPRIKELERVIVHPAMPFESLPTLAHHAKVLIMPYSDQPVTRAMQPLKLKEYMATGCAVVVRGLPSTRNWTDCVDVVESAEEFAECVLMRLRTGLPSAQSESRHRLVNESWARKACRLERLMFGSSDGATAHGN